MTILSQLYTSGGKDAVLHTLELSSDSWQEPIFLVRDFVNHTITTEDSQTHDAIGCGMAISLPKRDASGAQDLTFAIEGVRLQTARLLRQAIAAQVEVKMIHRIYLSSDLTAPAETPLEMIVKSVKAQANHVEVTASMFQFIDMKWPRDVYDSVFSPCLKYMQ